MVIIPYTQNQGKDNTDRRTNKRFKRRRRGGGSSYQENPERNLLTEVHLLHPEHSNREIEIKPSAQSTDFPVIYVLYLQRDKIWNRRTPLSYVYFISLQIKVLPFFRNSTKFKCLMDLTW